MRHELGREVEGADLGSWKGLRMTERLTRLWGALCAVPSNWRFAHKPEQLIEIFERCRILVKVVFCSFAFLFFSLPTIKNLIKIWSCLSRKISVHIIFCIKFGEAMGLWAQNYMLITPKCVCGLNYWLYRNCVLFLWLQKELLTRYLQWIKNLMAFSLLTCVQYY